MCGACVFMFIVLELTLPLFVTMEKATLEYDPLMGMRGRPNVKTVWTREIEEHPRTMHLNKYGFHDVQYDLKKAPGTHRVFFIGDSFLEAYQISIEENFCKILERDYNKRKPRPFKKVQDINGGLHTWGVGAYSLFVRHRLEKWDPDTFVLVLYIGNDLLDNYHLTAAQASPKFAMKDGKMKMTPPPKYTSKMWLRDKVLARSNVMRFLWLRVIRRSRAGFNVLRRHGFVGSPNMDPKTMTQKHYEEIAELTRRQILQIRSDLAKEDVGLFVYIIPVPRYINYLAGREWHGPDLTEAEAPYFLKWMDYEENALADFLEDEGIPYVYSRDEFVKQVKNGREVYLSDIGHMNAYGHQVSAKLIREPLWDVMTKKTSPDK